MGHTPMKAANLLDHLPRGHPGGAFFDALEDRYRSDRAPIVSHGQASAPGFWYDQDHHEWVLVMAGRAAIEIQGQPDAVELGPGSYLNLPAHARHRVAWTDAGKPTVWLAIHYGGGFGGSGFGVRGFGVRGSGFGVRGSGFGGSGFGVRGSGFGVRGSGLGLTLFCCGRSPDRATASTAGLPLPAAQAGRPSVAGVSRSGDRDTT